MSVAAVAPRSVGARARLGPLITERGWFDRPAASVAADLLGCWLVRDGADGCVAARIVETEAYEGPEDLAAHSARGRTARNAMMFGPPGHLYVYLIYGLHHCLNVVCGPGTKPEAVLLRGAGITEGLEIARRNRGAGVPDRRLAAGPGNLGAALGLDRSWNGLDLLGGPIRIARGSRVPLVRTARVGVAYAGAWANAPLRFQIPGDPHRSRP